VTRALLTLAWLLAALPVAAQELSMPALTLTTQEDGSQSWSLSFQVLVAMTLITLMPALLLSMTGFVRIIVVLGLLRQALGTGQTPSNPILIGLALMLTAFIMQPTANAVWEQAAVPYTEEEMDFGEAFAAAQQPMRAFMLAQTREADLASFARLAGDAPYPDETAVPFTVLAAAFVTSELKTAFQIGFLLFIPFVIIDLVVASVLMSLGMMMLSPMLISLPFKLMLFVLVDGWTLVVGALAGSFG
jgi:flagellar biosynthetic protein FliP